MADTTKGPRLKKDGTPFAKRGEGGSAVKRPAYLVYSIQSDDGSLEGAQLVVHDTTRNANDVLKATAGQTAKKYALIEI